MRSLRVWAVLAAALLSSCSSHANSSLPLAGTAQTALTRDALTHSETVLYNFKSPGYGVNYASPLTPDGHGDYFGMTEIGGTGHGTVYELQPDGKGGWKESTLHVFTGGLDGGTPQFTPLIFDKNGDLYGITLMGGSNERGVAFRMQRSGQTWTEHVIYDFGVGGSPGVNPFSFIADSQGNFFGTVNLIQGGAWTEGVFELSPSSKGWTASRIFVDGIPSATSGGGGIAIDANEHIFGVTSLAFQPSEIFELSPNGSAWTPKILYTFPRIRIDPEASPVIDKAGNVFGATVDGGPTNDGTIYELTSSHGSWTYKMVYAFNAGSSGAIAPYASITFGGNGTIYGAAEAGGAFNKGAIYKLTPSGDRYTSQVLWSFDGKDGKQPFGRVVLDANGDVFGTTTQGGRSGECYALAGCGNAFEIK